MSKEVKNWVVKLALKSGKTFYLCRPLPVNDDWEVVSSAKKAMRMTKEDALKASFLLQSHGHDYIAKKLHD